MKPAHEANTHQWEFLRTLSSNPKNTVIGLVRNKPETEKRVSEELSDRSNITILHGDLDDYGSLKVRTNAKAEANAQLLTTPTLRMP
jgi:hypothetical protein